MSKRKNVIPVMVVIIVEGDPKTSLKDPYILKLKRILVRTGIVEIRYPASTPFSHSLTITHQAYI